MYAFGNVDKGAVDIEDDDFFSHKRLLEKNPPLP
jgi:hypothetical protein